MALAAPGLLRRFRLRALRFGGLKTRRSSPSERRRVAPRNDAFTRVHAVSSLLCLALIILRAAPAPKNVEVPLKRDSFLAGKPNFSKFSRDKRSQTLPVSGRLCGAPFCLDAVAEDRTDFFGECAAMPYRSTLKESRHGRFDVANDNLSERWPPLTNPIPQITRAC